MDNSRAPDFERAGGASLRIVWRDGRFRLECTGHSDRLWLLVFQGDTVLAQEQVDSAEAAYRRGRELCDTLGRGPSREYGKRSGF